MTSLERRSTESEGSGLPPNEFENVFNAPPGHRLHARAAEMAHKLEQKRAAARAQAENNTRDLFQPKLITKKSSPYTKSNPYRSKKSAAAAASNKSKAYSRLYQDALLKKKRDMARKQAAARASEAKVKRNFITPEKAVSLYDKGQSRKEVTEAKVKKLAQDMTPNFAPKLMPARGATATATTADREKLYSPGQQQKREERLAKKKDEREMEHCTYTPTLISKKIPPQTKEQEDEGTTPPPAWDRLYSKAHSSPKADSYKQKKFEDTECTFTPNIKKSQASIPVKPEEGEKITIYDRLHREHENREVRLMDKANAIVDQELTFKPTIISKHPATTATDDVEHHGENRMETLYKQGRDKERRKTFVPKKRESEEKELTFQPNMNWKKGKGRSGRKSAPAAIATIFNSEEGSSSVPEIPTSISMDRNENALGSDVSDTEFLDNSEHNKETPHHQKSPILEDDKRPAAAAAKDNTEEDPDVTDLGLLVSELSITDAEKAALSPKVEEQPVGDSKSVDSQEMW